MITTKTSGRKTGWKKMCKDPFRLETPDGTPVMVRFTEDQVQQKYKVAADDVASSKDATPQDQRRAAKKRAKQALLLTDELTVAHEDNAILKSQLGHRCPRRPEAQAAFQPSYARVSNSISAGDLGSFWQ
jgi:hypothetical protein